MDRSLSLSTHAFLNLLCLQAVYNTEIRESEVVVISLERPGELTSLDRNLLPRHEKPID